jgi:hypothetical protein
MRLLPSRKAGRGGTQVPEPLHWGILESPFGREYSSGNEVAYNDDFRFNPDPILYYEIPKEGDYVLEIRVAMTLFIA